MPISIEQARRDAARCGLGVHALAGHFADSPAARRCPHEWLVYDLRSGRAVAEYHAADSTPARLCKAGRYVRYNGRSEKARSFREALRILMRYLRRLV